MSGNELEDEVLDNDILDLEAFDQLLSMDEDDDEFSKQIVYNYFEQAESTFDDMDKAVEVKDLQRLSRLGHFLKGSSASIGIRRVKECCEHIQHLGLLQQANGEGKIDSDTALKDIKTEIKECKSEYVRAKEFLHYFYEPDADDDNSDDDEDNE